MEGKKRKIIIISSLILLIVGGLLTTGIWFLKLFFTDQTFRKGDLLYWVLTDEIIQEFPIKESKATNVTYYSYPQDGDAAAIIQMRYLSSNNYQTELENIKKKLSDLGCLLNEYFSNERFKRMEFECKSNNSLIYITIEPIQPSSCKVKINFSY